MPEKLGVYIFKNGQGKILYVGKAVNIKKRVISYFQKGIYGKTALLISKTSSIQTIPVTSELEALLLEAHLIKIHRPQFNTRAKDDKSPLYIKITISDLYPRVFTVHKENEEGAVYFGPFPSSSTVKQVLKFLRSIFPFDTQRKIGKRPCFWSHLGLCNPCPSAIEKLPVSLKKIKREIYRKNIKNLVEVLSRKTEKVKRQLRLDMERAADSEYFEKAARLRDRLSRLNYITQEYHLISSFLENPNLVQDLRAGETKSLLTELLPHFPKIKKLGRIECFDASHTTLAKPTVGMVTFINGEPEKNFYRRFQIRGQGGDDLAFLEEALKRRFAHQEWKKPDLLVIDGGKTQVGRAREVLEKLKIRLPVIGIVKPFDDVVIPHQDGFLIKRLNGGPALHLLERLRDEAHRFARAYHRKLRERLFDTR